MTSLRYTRVPRIRILASCVALALAVGSGEVAASQAVASFTDTPAQFARLPPIGVEHAPLDPVLHPAMESHMRAVMVRPTPAVPRNSIAVTNCNDSGPGSFRDAVGSAVKGDTIDLSHVQCSTITLTTGSVTTLADDLTIQGPGVFDLSISGQDLYVPILHIGSGTLAISDITLESGHKYFTNAQSAGAKGGCIYSTGSVRLTNARVRYCSAESSNSTFGAKGGGIYGRLGVSLSSSTVAYNTASSSGSYAYGGGVYTQGSLIVEHSLLNGNAAISTSAFGQGGAAQVGAIVLGSTHANGATTLITYSSILDNTATGYGYSSAGGGLYTTGDVVIENSTIAANQAVGGAGLFLQKGTNVSQPFSLFSSTVSGNLGAIESGVVSAYSIDVYSSTITANAATLSGGSGLNIRTGTATLQSSIIAGNTTDTGSGAVGDDIDGNDGASLAGANNIVLVSAIAVPPHTIASDPKLGALSYNGGPTATHAILALSPAINAGNNPGFANDQRGPGFPRVIGTAADIGAYESDQGDLIFANGFD